MNQQIGEKPGYDRKISYKELGPSLDEGEKSPRMRLIGVEVTPPILDVQVPRVLDHPEQAAVTLKLTNQNESTSAFVIKAPENIPGLAIATYVGQLISPTGRSPMGEEYTVFTEVNTAS